MVIFDIWINTSMFIYINTKYVKRILLAIETLSCKLEHEKLILRIFVKKNSIKSTKMIFFSSLQKIYPDVGHWVQKIVKNLEESNPK